MSRSWFDVMGCWSCCRRRHRYQYGLQNDIEEVAPERLAEKAEMNDDNEESSLFGNGSRGSSPTPSDASPHTSRLVVLGKPASDDPEVFLDAEDGLDSSPGFETDESLEASPGRQCEVLVCAIRSATYAMLACAEAAATYTVPEEALERLAEQFPQSPVVECARYLAKRSVKGCPVKAAPKLQAYLDAIQNEVPAWPPAPVGLPPVIRFNGYAKDGSRILLFTPCCIDMRFGPEAYVHDVVRTMNSHLPRDSVTRCTVLMDTRPHRGYPNNNVLRIWNFLSGFAAMLEKYFVERVASGIIFPVGWVEKKGFDALKLLVNEKTREKLVCLRGSVKIDAPPPEELWEHVDRHEISAGSREFFFRA